MSRHPLALADVGTVRLAVGSVVVQSCRRPARAKQTEREAKGTYIYRKETQDKGVFQPISSTSKIKTSLQKIKHKGRTERTLK